MTNKWKKDPERPKRIAKVAYDLAELYLVQQKYHAKKAQEYGYSYDVFTQISIALPDIPDNPLLQSAELSLNEYKEAVEDKFIMEAPPSDVSTATYILGTAMTLSASLGDPSQFYIMTGNLDYPEPPPFWEPNRKDLYIEKLTQLDPELGKLLKSVRESFYSGIENSERTALSLMRQLYDHFFSLIASDDEVINSPYFRRKKGDKPKQIYRRERINYAANSKVLNKKRGKVLETQAGYYLKIYKDLNKLHKRGKLKREDVSSTLSAMEAVIEEWVDALA